MLQLCYLFHECIRYSPLQLCSHFDNEPNEMQKLCRDLCKEFVAHKKLFFLHTRLEFKPNFLRLFMLAQIDNYYLPATNLSCNLN